MLADETSERILSIKESYPLSLREFYSSLIKRRVDLVERSVRRGEGDPELAEALRRDAEGEWE